MQLSQTALAPRGRCFRESQHHGQCNSVSWKTIHLGCNIPGVSRVVFPLSKSLKTSKKREFQRLMLNTDMHNKQVVRALSLNCCGWFQKHTRKVKDEGLYIHVWHCYQSLPPSCDGILWSCVSSLISHGSWELRHGKFLSVLLEAQKMWDNKKFVVGLKGWKEKEEDLGQLFWDGGWARWSL